MARINLLPWRVERRKQREREFYMQLGAAFVAALLVLFVWGTWMGLRIDNQNDRNAYLQGEIKQLDVRLAKIKDLDKVRKRLLARKDIIEQLQANRAQMVHLFDELVKTIPNSTRLTGLSQNGQSMKIRGVAQSNASVAEYMRHIEASPWMGHAELGKTENSHNASRMPYTFNLDVKLRRPKPEDVPESAPALLAPPVASTAVAPDTAAGRPAGEMRVSASPLDQAAPSPSAGGAKPAVKQTPPAMTKEGAH